MTITAMYYMYIIEVLFQNVKVGGDLWKIFEKCDKINIFPHIHLHCELYIRKIKPYTLYTINSIQLRICIYVTVRVVVE